MNKSLVILVGGAVGATAGVLAAWLLAPSSGREVREDLRSRARDLGVRGQDGLEKIKIRATDLLDSGTKVARQVRERVTEAGATVKDQAQRTRRTSEGPSQGETSGPSNILGQAAEALDKVQAALESLRQATD